MRMGRRFSFFWISIFTLAGSGCAGCGDCFGGGDSGCGGGNTGCTLGGACDDTTCKSEPIANGHTGCVDGFLESTCGVICNAGYADCLGAGDCSINTSTDNNNCGGCGVLCGGTCTGGVCDENPGDASTTGALVPGINAPTGLASDGTDVYYVDQGTLMAYDPFVGLIGALATGVVPSGGMVADGSYVYWAGTYAPSLDGGVDAGDDAGDGGAIAPLSGIFRCSVTTGEVDQISASPAYATLALDPSDLYARLQLDADGGTSQLGVFPHTSVPDGGNFSPLATLSGNTGNLHAFALRSDDIVALDNSDLVSVLLDGGGKSTLTPDAGFSSVFSIPEGALSLTATDASFTFASIDSDASIMSTGTIGAVTSHGEYVYAVDESAHEIFQIFGADLPDSPTSLGVSLSGPVAFLAADDTYVYWIIAGQGLFRAPVP